MRTARHCLERGEVDLSVNQQLELEKKEQERFRQQMKELDAQIAKLNTSVQTDAETQKKKLQAQNALNKQKLIAAQEREKRLLEEEKRRQADMLAEANRKDASIKRRNSMSAEIERKVKDVRAATVQNSNIMERIAFLEMKKKTFSELQAELSKRKEEIDHAADAEFKMKKAEIEMRPWRAAELADGKPTVAATERRNNEIAAQLEKTRAQADKEKSAVEKELQPTSDSLLKEIISDYLFLEKTTVTISSIKNEKDIQYSIGAFDGNTNSWSVLLYFYNDGKESIGQYKSSISYQALTGKKTFAELEGSFRTSEQEDNAYNDFLDTVDMYNSLFARSEPVLTFEVDYAVEPWNVPSHYRICFKELRINDTLNGKILHSEKIADLEKIVSFPECYIRADYYAQILPSKSKTVPAYLLYEYALSAENNGDTAAASDLMHRAADKSYVPALNYFAQKEAEKLEQQRTAAEAKAEEAERQRQEKEIAKQRKKTQANALYDSSRLGFSLSGDFSSAVQNYAFEVKYNMGASCFHYGIGADVWWRKREWDALCIYGILGFSLPFKRVRPYIEGAFGFGDVNKSKESHSGMYWYGKGGLEFRLRPHISLDAFFKSQGTFWPEKEDESLVYEDKNTASQYAVAISGGIGVTYWLIFK